MNGMKKNYVARKMYVTEKGDQVFVDQPRFNIGDKVNVDFGDSGFLKVCEVVKIHLTKTKVTYDLDLLIWVEDLDGKTHIANTRVYNVDGAFCSRI